MGLKAPGNPKLSAPSRRNRPELFIKSEGMQTVLGSLLSEYIEYRGGERVRQLSSKERDGYLRHLNNIVTDTYSAWLGDPEKYVGYSRGKGNFSKDGSYWDAINDKPLLSMTFFLRAIDFLAERGYIENHVAKAGRNPHSSRMRATQKLIELLEAQVSTWASIRTDTSMNAIVVRDKESQIVPLPKDDDFDLTQAIENLRRINDNLQTSLINLYITDKEHEALARRMRGISSASTEADGNEELKEPLEFSNRSLRRVFKPNSFDCGGRFYGGWWQGLPKEYRKHIVIQDAITVEMDYSTIHPRILYALAETDLPDDAYTVPGWDVPGWNKELRNIAKATFQQLLNSRKGAGNPNLWGNLFAPDLDPDPLPEGWGLMHEHGQDVFRREEFKKRTGREYKELLMDLKTKHEPIDKYFFSEAWTWLQRLDADIAELVMLKLLDEPVPFTALPIHDSFIVRRGAEGALLRIMDEAFEEVVGVKAKVDRNATVYDGERRGSGIVKAADIWDDAVRQWKACTKYWRRRDEWQSVWGTID